MKINKETPRATSITITAIIIINKTLNSKFKFKQIKKSKNIENDSKTIIKEMKLLYILYTHKTKIKINIKYNIQKLNI